jgi:L-ascorbate metabolism protein UlaG (beta-lactamase superfamily)
VQFNSFDAPEVDDCWRGLQDDEKYRGSRINLKRPWQKDQIFLTDVQRVVRKGGRCVWWLGQSGFLVVQQGVGLVFDPYLSDSLTRKYARTDKPHTRITERVIDPTALAKSGFINLITSSHNHTDHLDAETLTPLLGSSPCARLVIPAANRQFVLDRLGSDVAGRLIELDDGAHVNFDNFEIHGVTSAHPTVERDSSGRCRFLGYVLHWNGLTFYHSGDTLLHETLVPSLKHFKIDIAFLPINGDRPERRVAGNLNGLQAAQLGKAINAQWVVPCHYDLFEFNTATPDEFINECHNLGQPYRVMQNGEGWEL